ncbi:MAG: hypothetical protein QOF58_7990 [Pseudonocardiales bacterium]|nr:hypothetical protein [Pseudonocardiales bacterium]
MAARGETQANVEVSTLVVPAWMLRWRAPELALVLGERAVALASTRRDEADRLRAESLVVFAGNRVGRGVRIADRAIDALKAAEAAGEHETAWLLRVELAACARSVGAPLTGFAAVTPVLEAPDVPAELRASALVQASECLVTVGRGDEPTRALAEADQLYVADTTLDDDTRLLLRGLIRAVQAAQHRRWGDIAAAIGAAREGLDLLGRFADPSADSGQGMGRLTLELVLALMDANRLLDASEVGAPLLDRPVRAPSASTSGWLRLALATRVHLPAGRVALAREMLREAAASAERHQLDTLLAESLLALAHVHEVSGELADALTNLRAAHAAERRRARAVYAVRARLAAEFSGVHRQPADLHQQLASLLRPVEGMQIVADGILSAALKQQLRTWRPVQVRKGDGLKVKRVRRAAEDMTVEGLSAARQHAAERWRTVQPFGEPDDKTPEPLEPPPPPVPSSDRTVPASGLIASAGAMVSGRRRAARVAAGEIDEDQPSTVAETPAPEPAAPQLSPDQERKRKVEEQLMELQREARRQIEAERQVRAEQRARAQREAAEESARQEAARQAAEREAAAREAAAREELAREAAAREVAEREAAAREEAARREAAAHDEASRAQPESVLEMLKAQGLRAGGRRRARDDEAPTSTDTPSWRVEPPSRLRQDDPAPQPSFGGQDHPDAPSYFADPSTPDAPSRSGLAAAFSRPPAAPDFGPHLDDPPPAYPLHTPAAGFPTTPADERTLPERDYTNLDFTGQQWATSSIPSPEPDPDPDHKPLPPLPDPVPSVPVPDEIPPSPEPDLLSSTFLSAADVEDDPVDVPTTPVRLPAPPGQTAPGQPGFGPQQGFGAETGFGARPGFGTDPGSAGERGFGGEPVSGNEHGFGGQPSTGGQPTFGSQSGFGGQPTFGTQTSFGTQSFGTQNFGSQPAFGAQTGFGTQPDSSPQADPTSSSQGAQPDPGGWANFEIGDDFDVDPIVTMSVRESGEPAVDAGFGVTAAGPASGSAASDDTGTGFDPATSAVDSPPQYDFFATEPETSPEPGSAAPAQSEIVAPDAAAPTAYEAAGMVQPAEAKDEPGAWTGRPSSRRKPSDLSLADLLAEALVAYETGRRSDEEQLGATDLTVPEWSASEPEQPPSTDSLLSPGRPASSPQPEPTAETGSGADFLFRAGESFGSRQAQESGTGSGAGTDSLVHPGDAFSSQQSPESATGSGSGADFRVRPGEASGSREALEPTTGSGAGADFVVRPGESFASHRAPESATGSEAGADSPFRSGQSFGSREAPESTGEAAPGADSLFQPGPSFGSQQFPATHEGRSSLESAFGSGQSFETPQPAASSLFNPSQSFGSQSPAAEPAERTAESEQERTGPIVPVGAAPDSETTGPIRPVSPDGPPGWTLPGT